MSNLIGQGGDGGGLRHLSSRPRRGRKRVDRGGRRGTASGHGRRDAGRRHHGLVVLRRNRPGATAGAIAPRRRPWAYRAPWPSNCPTSLWSRSSAGSRPPNREPKGELEHVNAFTLVVAVALSAQATDAGVNKATRGLFAVADTPGKIAGPRRRGRHGIHQDDRALPQQGEERRQAQPDPRGGVRRRGTFVARRPPEPARRGPENGERGAEHVVRSPRAGGRYPYLPPRKPQRHRAGTRCRRRGACHRGQRAGRVPAARAPLDDPARSLTSAWARKPKCAACIIRDLCLYEEKTL